MFYQQDNKFFEYRHGMVTIRFIIADSYGELFAEHDAGENVVDIFDLDIIEEDLDIAEGVFATDNLKLKLDPLRIPRFGQEITTDEKAYYFTLEAKDEGRTRYCAVLINPSYTDGQVDGVCVAFRGVINSKMSGQDILWRGNEYDQQTDSMRQWSMNATTFDMAMFNSIKTSYDIQNRSGSLTIPLTTNTVEVRTITEAEIRALADDYLGAYGHPEETGSWYIMDLCLLKACLQLFLDKAAELIKVKLDVDSYSITMEDSDLGIVVSHIKYELAFGTQNPTPAPFVDYPYVDTESQSHLKINADPGDGAAYVHLRMALPYDDVEKALSFYQYSSLSELFFGVARATGCYLSVQYVGDDGLAFKYVSRNSIVKDEVYIRDITDGSISTSPVSEQSAKKNFIGVGTPYSLDGSDPEPIRLDKTVSPHRYIPTARMTSSAGGEKMLLTSTWAVVRAVPVNTGIYISDPPGISRLNEVLTTGIYTFSGGNYSGDLTSYGPIGTIHITVNGEELVFNTLTGYTRFVFNRDTSFYSSQYELTLPFLNGFKLSPSDITGSWRNVVRGSKIILIEKVFDTATDEYVDIGNTYIVVGIARSLSRPETKLRLQLQSRYAFNVPTPGAIASIIAFPSYNDQTVRREMSGILECTLAGLDHGYTWNTDGSQIGTHYFGYIEHEWGLTNPKNYQLRLTPRCLTDDPELVPVHSCVPVVEAVDGDKLAVHIIKRNENTIIPENVAPIGSFTFEYHLIEGGPTGADTTPVPLQYTDHPLTPAEVP